MVVCEAALVTSSPSGRQPVEEFIGKKAFGRPHAKLFASGYLKGLSVASIG